MASQRKGGTSIQGFVLYRIFYGEHIVYVGRTKQPLQNRIRGHLFGKPMHRKIDIEQVSRIEYAEFKTEADMNLYEIYFILKWHPPLNVDDKAKDFPTVELPDVLWRKFETHLWGKWKEELTNRASEYERMLKRYRSIPEEMSVIRSLKRTGEIDDDEFQRRVADLRNELDALRDKLWK